MVVTPYSIGYNFERHCILFTHKTLYTIFKQNDPITETLDILSGPLIGSILGSIIGTAAGVYKFGSGNDEKEKVKSYTKLGSLLGMFVGLGYKHAKIERKFSFNNLVKIFLKSIGQ